MTVYAKVQINEGELGCDTKLKKNEVTTRQDAGRAVKPVCAGKVAVQQRAKGEPRGRVGPCLCVYFLQQTCIIQADARSRKG